VLVVEQLLRRAGNTVAIERFEVLIARDHERRR
jgi:hypothetical protein